MKYLKEKTGFFDYIKNKKKINQKSFLLISEILEFEKNNEGMLEKYLSKKNKKEIYNKCLDHLLNVNPYDLDVVLFSLKMNGLSIVDSVIKKENELKTPTMGSYMNFLKSIFDKNKEQVSHNKETLKAVLKNIIEEVIENKLLKYDVVDSKTINNKKSDSEFEIKEKYNMLDILLNLGSKFYSNEELFEKFKKLNFDNVSSFSSDISIKSKIYWDFDFHKLNPSFFNYLVEQEKTDILFKNAANYNIHPQYSYYILLKCDLNEPEKLNDLMRKTKEKFFESYSSKVKIPVFLTLNNTELLRIYRNTTLNKDNLFFLIDSFLEQQKEYQNGKVNVEKIDSFYNIESFYTEKLNILNCISYYDVIRSTRKCEKDHNIVFFSDEFYISIFNTEKMYVKDLTQSDLQNLFISWIRKTKDLKIVNKYATQYGVDIFEKKDLLKSTLRNLNDTENNDMPALIKSYKDVLGYDINISDYLIPDVDSFNPSNVYLLDNFLVPIINNVIENDQKISYKFLRNIKENIKDLFSTESSENNDRLLESINGINISNLSKIKVLKFISNKNIEQKIHRRISLIEKDMINEILADKTKTLEIDKNTSKKRL